ncbi:putative pentatricopeptide repeat-containing protein At3g01580 [Selaginella moellendorffii]|nr:putative pentatricopeptide repeat-containing protein At3g01580 [Selaginella moellendorffii]|eukprot:XP_024536050.1 putative pentatricopeptide repeat-containing protein At3g01580 [Selaginella moellendorffii]
MVDSASRPGGGIRLYDRAQEQGRRPTTSVVIAALQECGRSKDLAVGRRIHAGIAQIGLDATDVYIANTLIAMYSKCGSLVDARAVFDRLDHRRTAVSWNTMILGYVDANLGDIALDLFDRMDCAPGIVSYLAAARACASAAAREEPQEIDGNIVRAHSLRSGREIHRRAWREGHRSSRFLANSLLTMYAKCGSLIDARAVFDEIASSGEIVAWNAMIFGYGEAGHGAEALRLFSTMQQEGFVPDKVTFLAAIKACSPSLRSGPKLQWFLLQGRAIHSMIAKLGYGRDVVISNALISMYSRCGSVADARRVFDQIDSPSLVSWNSIIAAYADASDGAMALEFLLRMEESGCDPDSVTFLAALKACSTPIEEQGRDLLEKGRALHTALASRGFHRDPFVANALVTMYSRRGSLGDARSVFETIEKPSIVSWNAIIQGYVESGDAAVALDLFSQMPHSIDPDAVTFLAAIKACSSLAAQEQGQNLGGTPVKIQSLARGREIHRRATAKNLEREIAVANSFIAMYARCGSMADARSVFDRMEPRSRTAVSWTALMAGYNDAGEPDRALECFERMIQEDRCNPDGVALAAVIKACGSLGALEIGRKIHSQYSSMVSTKSPNNELSILANSIVDFYGKCGSMDEARAAFDSIESARRDVVTWNSLIAGYSRAGDFQQAFDLLERMMQGEERLRPNGVTILSILSVCARAGLVDRGREVFSRAASSGYGSGVALRLEHYTVMVDLLGRSNQLEEAVELIRGMPWEANAKIWMTLLDACAKWRNPGIAKLAFDSVIGIDRNNAAAHVLIASICESV